MWVRTRESPIRRLWPAASRHPEWAQTAGIYARGYLQHHCGVRLEDIRWVQAGVNEPGRKEKVSLSLPPGVSIRPAPERSLSQMLAEGEIDAAITAREPDAFVKRRSAYRAAVAPLAATRRSVLPRDRCLSYHARDSHQVGCAGSLSLGCHESLQSFRRIQGKYAAAPGRASRSRVPFAWAYDAVAHAQEVFGQDCWPYGLERNRRTLERSCSTATSRAHQRKLQVENFSLARFRVSPDLKRFLARSQSP